MVRHAGDCYIQLMKTDQSNDARILEEPVLASRAIALIPGALLLAYSPLWLSDDEDGADNDDNGDDDLDDGVITQTDVKTKRPQLYKVLMLNDDYTPMEFVVHVLQRYFRMNMEEATQVMLHVHQKGVGVCGVFPYDVAETKVNQVMDLAKKHQHPLQCTLEKE